MASKRVHFGSIFFVLFCFFQLSWKLSFMLRGDNVMSFNEDIEKSVNFKRILVGGGNEDMSND